MIKTATILNAFQAGGINLVSAQDATGQIYLITDLPPVKNGQMLRFTEAGWVPVEPIHDDLSELCSRS